MLSNRDHHIQNENNENKLKLYINNKIMNSI